MNEIGSIWRKWDLHLHTASSYDYLYKESDADNILIQSLVKNQISVVAITDHFIIDKDRIRNLRTLAPNIIFFPGVELRTDKGDTNIHVILIFDDKIDLDVLCEDFNAFKRNNGKNLDNDERIYWDYNDIIEFAKQHGALVSIHAGRKENGLDRRISNALEHNQAVKEEFAKTVDIFEIGQERDLTDYNKYVFPSIKHVKPMVICSDNHDPRRYNSSLWIKADLTFNGLKQIINEPSRVSIREPEILNRIKLNPLKFIKKLVIRKKPESSISDIWYDNTNINMNPGLVAIIGNKGSGKSAITDIIGLCADTHNENWSFLTPQKFKKPKPYNLSQNFEAQIVWEDNSTSTLKSLDCIVDKNQPERIKYIPQNFLENICTTEDDKDFENEMKSIIFQYLPEEQKYGKPSLDDVVTYLSQEIYNSEEEIKTRINSQNRIIIELEGKKSPDYRTKLESALRLKQEEFENLQNIKPPKIEKPNHSGSSEAQKVKNEIENLQIQIKETETEIANVRNEFNSITRKIHDLNAVKDRIKRFCVAYQNMIGELNSVCLENVLNIEAIIKVIYDTSSIDNKIQVLKSSSDKCSKLLGQNEGSLIKKKDEFIIRLKQLEEKLSEPDKLYQKYLSDLTQWQMKVDSIQGNKETTGTILFYEEQLKYLDEQLEEDLVTTIQVRRNSVLELIQKKREILNTYSLLYRPISEFIEKYKDELKAYPIELDASFVFDNIVDLFFGQINQQVAGSFCGKEQGVLRLKNLCNTVDLTSDDSIYDFVFSLNEMLVHDKRDVCNNAIRVVEAQLRKGYSKEQLYDFMYDLDYIKPLFKLKLSEKELSALSPGERGALLLLFYLFIDMDDKPLVIDQPEENLDNESVYEYLVAFIKKAKCKRQIIMVTHNPNLAVVCDADQIIKMNIDKEHGNRVSFISGAIESKEMNKSIVDVLEGTYPAFRNRDSKYLK